MAGRRPRAGRVPLRSATDPCNGPAAAGFWGVMDTDSPLIDALAADLDGSFEALVLAHQDRLYSIALRVLGDPRDAEEAAQDASSGPTGRWPVTTRHGSASSACGRGWRRSSSTCAARGSTRRPARARRRCRSTRPLPGELEPRSDDAPRTGRRQRRRDATRATGRRSC